MADEADALAAFSAVNDYFGIDPPGVPLIVVGGLATVGFDTAEATGAEIRMLVQDCRTDGCVDSVAAVLRVAGLGLGG